MTKVFQTIVSKDNGNCMQAVIASLFDKPLNQVPNFIEFGDQWFSKMRGYYSIYGYEPVFSHDMTKYCGVSLKEIAKYDGGIDGYFYGSVPSQTFEDIVHAVVVDTDLNIVHDPNPNQKALNLKSDDVMNILTVGNWYLDENGNFIKVEDNA